MGHKIIHIVACDCCGRSWQSSSYNKVKDYVDTLELHTSTGAESLVLCRECNKGANFAIRSVYGALKAGKPDISIHAYHGDNEPELIDLDKEVD